MFRIKWKGNIKQYKQNKKPCYCKKNIYILIKIIAKKDGKAMGIIFA